MKYRIYSNNRTYSNKCPVPKEVLKIGHKVVDFSEKLVILLTPTPLKKKKKRLTVYDVIFNISFFKKKKKKSHFNFPITRSVQFI